MTPGSVSDSYQGPPDRRTVLLRELARKPPAEDSGNGLASAFWLGYRNPFLAVSKAGPTVGQPGSDARTYYLAGQRRRKRSSHQLQTEQP